MSFYVTLPSNSSMDFYPNNSLTHYTTKLHAPLKLEGQYEVALTEILYPYNWKYRSDAQIIVKHNDKRRTEIYDVKFHAFETVTELFDSVNDFMRKKNVPIKFSYNRNNSLVTITVEDFWTLEFTNGIQNELGFKAHKYQTGPGVTNISGRERIYEHLNPVNSLYIYSDICEHQFVGDSYSPLLRVVAVESNYKYGQIVDKIFTSPHYVPLVRNNVDTIEIDIRSDTGEHIQFSAGKLLIKLHFRPRY